MRKQRPLNVIRYAQALGLFLSATACFAQCDVFPALENRWDSIWPRAFGWVPGHEDSVQGFKRSVIAYLQDGSSWNCWPSDTGKLMAVLAPDSSFRVISWDEISGGSSHDMASLLQAPNGDATCVVRVLDPESPGTELEENPMENVVVHQIHRVTGTAVPTYLLFGWGTHGGGHQHQTIQAITRGGRGLERCEGCFPTGRSYGVEYTRSDTLDLTFDAGTNTISHNGFRDSAGEEEPDGFKQPTGKRVRLEWLGDRFAIKPE